MHVQYAIVVKYATNSFVAYLQELFHIFHVLKILVIVLFAELQTRSHTFQKLHVANKLDKPRIGIFD